LGLGGLAGFWTELTESSELGISREVELRKATVLWRFGHALQILRELCIACGYVVPDFHQFCVLFGVSPVV
jgi:hypothetical protein